MHHCVAVPDRIAACHGHGTGGHTEAHCDHQSEANCVAYGDRRGDRRTHPNRNL